MATTTIPDFEAASERVAAAGRTITGAYLDSIEKYADTVAQFERNLGEQSKVELISELVGAHAQTTQDLTKASVRFARELIAAY